jgi:hypothetical protein
VPAKRKVAFGRPCCGHQCLQIGMGDTPVDFSLDLGGHEFLAFRVGLGSAAGFEKRFNARVVLSHALNSSANVRETHSPYHYNAT